ncbi:lysosomal acid phosphatase-like [Uranotaenia lowii]|uniref:lysosomal acid phosphatase-like n=1 Tax=Uranotaenia lowii TaxID=190385 RepID=UPI002478B676|nr:lysosomal acid phosphatase-like [Uranotaenia lowii]
MCSKLTVAILALAVLAVEVHTGISPLSKDSTDSLQLVILLFRHGGRSPAMGYPADPYANYPWIGGLGALQPKGTEQTFELGQNLRKRYGSLLPSNGFYSTQNVYAVSSSVERCIMSAQSILAAFLRPESDTLDIPIRWQPTPIVTIPAKDDYILQQSRSCNKFNQEYGRFMMSPTPEFQPLNNEFISQYDYLSKHAGYTVNSWMTALGVYDALIVENQNGLALPGWSNSLSGYSRSRLRRFS